MILSIINQKDRTEKTTTTVNLGSTLAQKGFRVLLTDFDPQSNLTYSLGINNFDCGIRDVLENSIGLEESIVERESMHILPNDQRLAIYGI